MPNRFASVLIAGVLCSTSVSALAQPAPAAPSTDTSDSTTVSGVVIQAHKKAEMQAFAKAVETFVHAQGRPGMNGQISRWRHRVCPMTAGLAPNFNAFVSKRVKEVAARVGVPAGVCQGVNVLVVFTALPDRVMADVRDHHAALLGYHQRSEAKSLAVFEPPMKSWYVTGTRQGDSMKIDYDNGGLFPDLLPHGAGHLPAPFFSDFGFALVVVDSKQIEGREIGPVADQIAMLALSKPAPREGCSPLPTVMDVLDPACPSSGSVKELTVYDEAFLKALYAYNGDEGMAFERASIRQRIVKETGPPKPDVPAQ